METRRKHMAGELTRYLSAIGSKGGKAGTGASKCRGDAAYYKRISKKAAKARKAKAANVSDQRPGDRDSTKNTSSGIAGFAASDY